MPELPEVETMKLGIAPVVGCRIADVERADCRLKPIDIQPGLGHFRRRVVGRAITGLARAGKRVVIQIEGVAGQPGDAIVIEPRMTGLVLLAAPPNQEHLRWRLTLSGGEPRELLFWDRRGLGSVRLVTAAEFDERYGLERLGPDALGVSAELLAERLAASRREIKVALLDQRAVAGIGNLYASEILHLAGVHPQRRCDEIRRAEWQRLASATLEILKTAILYEGSTLSDGTYRNALNQAGDYQSQHRVYDRADQICRTCHKRTVSRIVQAQRSTFFCARCQPVRSPRNKG